MRKNFSWFLLAAALLFVAFIAYDSMRGTEEVANASARGVGPSSAQGIADDSRQRKPDLKDPSEDSMTPSLLAKAQERLKALGYYRGDVDGRWSRDLDRAVKSFQKAKGLRVSGVLDGHTRALLEI